MVPKIFEIESVSDFLTILKDNNKSEHFRKFYRGQGDVDYSFLPGILRNPSWIENEQKIYNDVLIECPDEFKDCNSHSDILTKMQHYGVRTRLLDITSNPLISLYFACEESYETDGVVYALNAIDSIIKTYDSDAISILSALPKLSFRDLEALRDTTISFTENHIDTYDIKKFNEMIEVKKLLHQIKNEKPAFENIINPNDLMRSFIFRPQKLNSRIIRQSGAFIIFGLNPESDSLKLLLNDNSTQTRQKTIKATLGRSNRQSRLKAVKIHDFKILIKAEFKEAIIIELASLEISKASIYPELYKVAEFINNRYS